MSTAAEGAKDPVQLKDEGNKLFQSGDYLKAAALYTQAIKLDPENAVLYSNRCAALLKLKKITKATEDAEKCIQLKPDWEKGYFRKGAILEDQEHMQEALEVYQTAHKLCPDSKELAQKIRTLSKVVNKAKGAVKDDAADKASAPPAPVSATASQQDVVYEDLGSEEVARFTEEYLGVLAGEVRDNGIDFQPQVHFLPGPRSQDNEEQNQHVQGLGAFESPATLHGFVEFLRTGAERLDAQAVMAIVPKKAMGYPQTWTKPKWPCGAADGVFAQLESRKIRKCWFVPVLPGKKVGTPQSLSADDFGPLPKILRT